MKALFKIAAAVLLILTVVISCKQADYSMGDLTAPSNIVIDAQLVGKDGTHPNGDGSGDVNFTITASNGLSYKIDYDAADGINLDFLASGRGLKKYTKLGLNTYRVTVVVYGKGGTSSTATKDVTVQSNFVPDPTIVANLTGGGTKTWYVDKDVAGHFGVGPWSTTSVTPEWWAAAPNEKVACCNCFYTARFAFTKTGATSYTLTVTTPDGAFTKTGGLTTLPGIPGSGSEACYSYGGSPATAFNFVPSGSGIAASAPSTKTAIELTSNSQFIGYGSLQKEYEIMVITPTYLYLRARGTETGNAWYLKLKPM